MRNVIESSNGKEPAATPNRSPAPFHGVRLLITKNHFIFMEVITPETSYVTLYWEKNKKE